MPRLFPEIAPNTSVGTGPILAKLSELASSQNRPIWDTVLINLFTILRNNYHKSKSIQQIKKDTMGDVDLLLIYLERYMELDNAVISDPKVVVYIPAYFIPNVYIKKFSPIYIEQMRIFNILIKDMKDYAYKIGELGVHLKLCGNREELPHLQLYRYLNTVDKTMKYKRHLIITHIPVDLHISKNILNFSLLESFTANIKDKIYFNKKVFGTDVIPFYGCFHLLFGDKIHFKKSLTKKQADIVLTAGKNRRWLYMSEEFVVKDLLEKLRIVDNKDFFKYKL